MDIRLYLRVLWRFKLLVVPGIVAAGALAFLTMAKIDTHGSWSVSYRTPQKYVSYSTLFVTKPGFPWGRLNMSTSEQTHLASLAIIYANLVTSDQVKRVVREDGPMRGTLQAAPVLVESTGEALPLVRIAAIASSREAAISLAGRASAALQRWIAQQQRLTATPESQRVLLQEVAKPREAILYRARSRTLAIIVFLSVLTAAIGAAFTLENLRPRSGSGQTDERDQAPAPSGASLQPQGGSRYVA